MDQCRFRRRAMGRERPGRGEGGRRTAVRYVWGAKKAVISSISCTFMLRGAARGSGQQRAKKSEKSQDPPRSPETYNGRCSRRDPEMEIVRSLR